MKMGSFELDVDPEISANRASRQQVEGIYLTVLSDRRIEEPR
jgi:hypothetical protein